VVKRRFAHTGHCAAPQDGSRYGAFFGVVEMVEIETKLHSNATRCTNKSTFTFDMPVETL
jgi:hypothetical protein